MEKRPTDYGYTDRPFPRSASHLGFSQGKGEVPPYPDSRFHSSGASYWNGGAGPSGQPQLQVVPYSAYHGADNFHTGNPSQPSRSKTLSSWNSVVADPDIRRRGRIASYKRYTVEGRIKLAFSRSMRWVKNKYLELRYEIF
ncbi:hypothetical protein KP509_26G000600 [Ceratopteris richardii]|uniref:Uncharacterized protein n=1 Tax=Ceratopteris richardii TaxID=49495 RepID=A0A8T2RJ17_CERRI|nr:hypothetical protein KP509_26G000600 [Ceratopteris richardii]